MLTANALPGRMYTSTSLFHAEMEYIHLRNWFFVGLAGELPMPGDYRAIDTVGGPLILLRDQGGELRAFANCCRHRGSLLLTGSGNVHALRCPYHAWAYGLDGSLLAVPAMALDRWSTEQAKAWYDAQAWPVGSDYIPADAINQLLPVDVR